MTNGGALGPGVLALGHWKKSSYSGTSGNCVEVAAVDGHRAVRDSKDPHGPILRITTTEWAAFNAGIRRGEFD